MPITVNVRPGQVVEFPDDATVPEMELVLRKDFPPTGEEVSQWLDEDPGYVPTFSEYQSFETYNKDHGGGGEGFGNALIGYGERLAGLFGAAAKSIAKDPGFLLTHRMDEQADTVAEALAQGTAQMRQMLFESTDPESFLFRMKSKLNGASTQEDRYDQFLEARAFGQTIRDLDQGSRLAVDEDRPINEEAVGLGREFLDPTMVIPGLGISKIASKPLLNAARSGLKRGGNAIANIPRTAARGAESVSEAVSDVVGKETAEALRGVQRASRLGGVADAMDVTADAVGRPPSRIGPLGQIADDARSPSLLRAGANAARTMGGDAVLDVGGAAARGSLEGSMIGGVLGYANNRDFGGGAGGGFVMGNVGGLANRVMTGYSGKDYQTRLQNDVAAYRAELPADVVQPIMQMAGTDLKRQADLFDMHMLATQGGDVAVRYLDKKEYQQFQRDHFGKGGKTRGVTYTTSEGQPTIVINKGAPGSQIAHELLGHALVRFEQTNPEALRVQDEVYKHIGSDALLADAEAYSEAMGDAWKSRTGWDRLSDGERIKFMVEERAADYAEALVNSRGRSITINANQPWRAFRDRMILAEADSLLGRAYGALNRFGITLDSVPPGPKNPTNLASANPRIHAAIHSLIRARKRTRDQLNRLDSTESRVIRKQTIAKTPELGAQLEQIGLAKQKAGGKGYELRPNDEIHAAEVRQAEEITRILDQAPGGGEGGVRGFEGTDGSRTFEGERFSPDQLAAVERSTVLSPYLKRAIAAINEAIANHSGLDIDYFAATRKDSKGRTRYSSGIKQSRRTILPYALEVSAAGNFFVKALDFTKLNAKLDKLLKTERAKFEKAYGKEDTRAKVLGDFIAYTQNLSKPKGQRVPSESLFGPGKRDLLQRLFGPRNPEKNLNFTRLDERENVVQSFRPDRLARMSVVEGALPEVTEQAYQLAKANYSPLFRNQLVEVSSNPKGGAVYSTTSGYRAIRVQRRNRWKVYGPNGKPIGKTFKDLDAAQDAIDDRLRQTGFGS